MSRPRYPQKMRAALTDKPSASSRFERIEAAPEKAATSLQGLTKSTPAIAKQQGASMATPQDKPPLRPDDERHGTVAGYAQKCRCSDCREAINTYQRRRRKREGLYGHGYSVPALGTRRRVEALMALGWTAEQIAKECGWPARNNVLQLRFRTWVERKTAATVAATYKRLHMTVPKGPFVERNRKRAKNKGWAVPLMWDDIDNDPEPNATDDDSAVDEVKVRRVISGWPQDCNTAERYAVIEAWTGSNAELERLTGWNIARMMKREAA